MSNEKTPLLPSNAGGIESSKYYFLKDGSQQGGTTESVRDADGGPVHETLPSGSTPEEFAPRVIGSPAVKSRKGTPTQPATTTTSGTGSGGSFLSGLFGGGGNSGAKRAEASNMIKPRKAPVKVEPKVFFANERTFLAWMHLSVMLAGASIAILAFAEDQNPFSQIYGVILLPVAVAFIVHAMYQYARRAYMIRNRLPGPYDDTTAPTVLGMMLMLSILAQFSLKLYSMKSI
ncbi:Vacuolar transporter chaperone 1 [Seminavis robusta]|uniref:Vacuolar transporter chaperone 1 n=1 Tax=Seminavis robusta TaxID=568900 RepID=A0A9N8E0L5_9STRA|nr:Vacuolar transporter chaperone 1 [Seminavis robusta]|eukprot:Sro530_g161160.1 Vacuolar transporter chaperone 1 (232) ;mRNA; f:20454-21462